LRQAVGRARIGTLLADADFDAEWVHESVRSHGIRSIIPAKRGRPTEKPPTGRWRRRMKTRFSQYKAKYGQRWQVETVNSMIKRRLGSALRARKYQNQCRETVLRAITYNVMIVRLEVFYEAGQEPNRSQEERGHRRKGVRSAWLKTIEPGLTLPRNVGCENEQIAAARFSGRLRCRLQGPSRISAQIQPEEVHSAPVDGLPGA
jgi:Transposase DDE domain